MGEAGSISQLRLVCQLICILRSAMIPRFGTNWNDVRDRPTTKMSAELGVMQRLSTRRLDSLGRIPVRA